ncbi:hypothetical protein GCM10007907_04850 [Chitinimonas prasina]|uniref:Secreted protein n=1 Tax=Chitinimonas prasina TaxID=1434937 RepID=A0ABQ5YEC9_9NEIS|nr:hypothetical protein [Chitinimonas prasina]GLR11695.1 hypothetical protein GCM10007907_04850 [Chitinimonas prasina]
MTHSQHLLPLLMAGALALPAHAAEEKPADAFFRQLSSLCGKAFEGRLVEGNPNDTRFREQKLTMHVRECSPEVIRVPFHVGDDHSRTWVISRTAQGLRLKHDHRHADGSEDSITQYGGDTAEAGTASLQSFPADAHTAKLIPAAAENTWRVEILPGQHYSYQLQRGERRFRVDFDLTKPVALPPAPWGAKP